MKINLEQFEAEMEGMAKAVPMVTIGLTPRQWFLVISAMRFSTGDPSQPPSVKAHMEKLIQAMLLIYPAHMVNVREHLKHPLLPAEGGQ